MRFPMGLSASLAAYIIRKKLAREDYIPLVLMLEPLFACNLSCATCGRIREYKDRASEMMTPDECIKSTRECGAPIVSICGGEPLIYPEIAELTDRLVRMKRYVYLCTNGLRLAQSLEGFRPSPRLQLNVHVDGPRETHDAIVGREGAYDCATEGIIQAVRRGFKVTVNTTVCRETDLARIETHMRQLESIGVSCFMLSPAYSYEAVDGKEHFMSRADVHARFRDIDGLAGRHRLADTPIYLEYLKGERELECTAWGNPTRNPAGWRSPCYLIADQHFGSYRELIDSTDWSAYGRGRDPRCEDCMVHCGFEPTAALMRNKRRGDLWKMLKWQLS